MSKKVRCIDCHFLFNEYVYDDSPSNRIERKSVHIKLRNEYDNFINKTGANLIGCHFGIWEETGPMKKEQIKTKAHKKRDSEKCLFYKFEDGLTLEGAEILQKRNEDREAFKTTMFYSRLAIVVAIIALLLNLHDLFVKAASPAALF